MGSELHGTTTSVPTPPLLHLFLLLFFHHLHQFHGRLPVLLPTRASVRIGRSDSGRKNDVELNGLGIAKEHCVIYATNPPAASPEEEEAVAEPPSPPSPKRAEARFIELSSPEAMVYVNGRQLGMGKARELRHGDRVVLGSCTAVYVMVIPSAVEGVDEDIFLKEMMPSYWDALEEMFLGKQADDARVSRSHVSVDDVNLASIVEGSTLRSPVIPKEPSLKAANAMFFKKLFAEVGGGPDRGGETKRRGWAHQHNSDSDVEGELKAAGRAAEEGVAKPQQGPSAQRLFATANTFAT